MLPQYPVSLQTAASALLEWLDEQHPSCRQQQSSTPRAIRARVRVQPGPNAPLSWLRANHCSQRMYFRNREQTLEVAALGFAHIARGPVFTQQVQSSLISILNPADPDMRFYGACRFDSSEQSRRDEEWRPYHGFMFVLPMVELYRNNSGQFFLAANYYPPSESSLLHNLLRRIVSSPRSLQTLDASFLIPRTQNVADLTAFATWDTAMSTILQRLSTREYDKIVLARVKRFSFSSASIPDPVHVIAALDEQNRENLSRYTSSRSGESTSSKQNPGAKATGGSYLFCMQLDHDKAFVGCTPERLFFSKGRDIWTEALAATVRRSADGNEGEVLSELLSQKNIEEHRFVVDYIRTALSDSGVHVETNGPHVRRLPRLMHLATHIRGEVIERGARNESVHRSDSANRTHNVFKVLETMHPTPAVCGMPRERTLKELQNLEDFDRGLFAGPLGWFSFDSGEFCVAIRSALLHGSYVTAFAGSGIVRGSESKSEWDETELKMSAFTDLFTMPCAKNRAFPASPRLNDCRVSNGLSPRRYVKSSTDGDMKRVLSLRSGDYYGDDALDSMTPAFSTLSTDDQSFQASVKTLSKSSSASSVVSSTKLRVIDFPAEEPCEDKYFDPYQIEKMPNINALWGCCCIEELCRNGVRTFFVAPGSRSAPLAVGVARSRHAQFFVAHDERGAGFLAVGYARATGRAAAVITSSGTAVANLLPSVVEAYMDSLPMILLTADRPPELRGIGANQAIYQPGIFGEYTRWSKDFPCPSSEIPLRNLLSDIDHAVYVSGSSFVSGGGVHAFRGPVHLNMMFREKLSPDYQPWDRSCLMRVPLKWRLSVSPITTYAHQTYDAVPIITGTRSEGYANHAGTENDSFLSALQGKEAGLIVVGGASGSAQTEDDGLAIYETARLLGWPIVADICSGLRLDNSIEKLIHYADQIYSSEHVRQILRPDAVLQFGERVTSKRINRVIEEASSRDEGFIHVLVSTSARHADPVFSVTHRVVSDINRVLRQVQAMVKTQHTQRLKADNVADCESMYQVDTRILESKLQKLTKLSRRVHEVLQKILVADTNDGLTEPWCARVLSESLPRTCALFIGNSMPIRDLDAFASPREDGLEMKVAANRGASGIDGIISSGIGFGVGLKKDVTILLGDMSLIHDMNALHLLRAEESAIQIRVTIVVVNNRGGGIFSMLPIAKHREVFSPVFNTPHSINFSKVCESFGIEYCTARTARELSDAVRKTQERHRVIEAVVVDDHSSNAALHKRLSANVTQQVSAVLANDSC